MKRIAMLILCALLVGFAASFSFADEEQAGSSTNAGTLGSSPNVAMTDFYNSKSGNNVRTANKVSYTDASGDRNPLQGLY